MDEKMLEALNANEFVVFDTETTGLGPALPYGKIIEIGAVKIRDGEIVDSFSEFINPEMKIPKKIVELTHITDEMVCDSDTTFPVLTRFKEFCGKAVLVAHNSSFDMSFLKFWLQQKSMTMDTDDVVIDTLAIDKYLFPDSVNHKLGTIAERFSIVQEAAHRAVDDARVTAIAFLKMKDLLKNEIAEHNYCYCCTKNVINLETLKYRRFGDFIKPGDKKKAGINRLYVNLYYPDDSLYCTVFYDRNRKEWFNKDIPENYEIDFTELEKQVLILRGGVL